MKFGLLGFPLEHSFSRSYFTKKFRQENINAEFLNFEIATGRGVLEIKRLIENYPDLCGFSVTIPHKETIISCLDSMSDEAKKVGAVNCVKVERIGKKILLTGHNTDIYGFRYSLDNFIPKSIEKAIILGNGGAAKAVRHVLTSCGTSVLTASRTPEKNGEIHYAEIPILLKEYRLMVNTTPLGMFPNTATFPDIPYHLLTPEHYLFDLVYNPQHTLFMQKGASAGARVKNGMEMLERQAEEAWKIWNKQI